MGGVLKATFGIYLGWICIATIANVTALLVNTGWGGMGISQEAWTIIIIATGTLIVSLTVTFGHNSTTKSVRLHPRFSGILYLPYQWY